MAQASATQRQITLRIPRVLVFAVLAAVGLGVFIGLLFLWVALSTGAAAAKADSFMNSIAAGDYEGAYRLASNEFREAQGLDRLTLEMTTLGPARFETLPWKERTLQRTGFTFFGGTLETVEGARVPFTIQMVDRPGGWAVLALSDTASSRYGAGVWFRQAPAESVTFDLVRNTLLDLNEAVQARNFEQFYNKIEGTWRLQIKLSPIGKAFDVLVEQDAEFSQVGELQPVFSEPPDLYDSTNCGAFGGGCTKTATGDLLANGHYQLDSGLLEFELVFRYRHPEWSLACAIDRRCIVSLEP